MQEAEKKRPRLLVVSSYLSLTVISQQVKLA